MQRSCADCFDDYRWWLITDMKGIPSNNPKWKLVLTGISRIWVCSSIPRFQHIAPHLESIAIFLLVPSCNGKFLSSFSSPLPYLFESLCISKDYLLRFSPCFLHCLVQQWSSYECLPRLLMFLVIFFLFYFLLFHLHLGIQPYVCNRFRRIFLFSRILQFSRTFLDTILYIFRRMVLRVVSLLHLLCAESHTWGSRLEQWWNIWWHIEHAIFSLIFDKWIEVKCHRLGSLCQIEF